MIILIIDYGTKRPVSLCAWSSIAKKSHKALRESSIYCFQLREFRLMVGVLIGRPRLAPLDHVASLSCPNVSSLILSTSKEIPSPSRDAF